jgi:hypothetical protein
MPRPQCHAAKASKFIFITIGLDVPKFWEQSIQCRASEGVVLINRRILCNTFTDRVARWFVFDPKIPILVKFGGFWNKKCSYILWSFGIFYVYLVKSMAFWYSLWSFDIFLRFGMFGPRKIWQPCSPMPIGLCIVLIGDDEVLDAFSALFILRIKNRELKCILCRRKNANRNVGGAHSTDAPRLVVYMCTRPDEGIVCNIWLLSRFYISMALKKFNSLATNSHICNLQVGCFFNVPWPSL